MPLQGDKNTCCLHLQLSASATISLLGQHVTKACMSCLARITKKIKYKRGFLGLGFFYFYLASVLEISSRLMVSLMTYPPQRPNESESKFAQILLNGVGR